MRNPKVVLLSLLFLFILLIPSSSQSDVKRCDGCSNGVPVCNPVPGVCNGICLASNDTECCNGCYDVDTGRNYCTNCVHA